MIGACFQIFAVQADELEDGKTAYEVKDYSKAAAIFTPLAQEGDTSAQSYLGYMAEYGLGRNVNKVEAFQWYEKSANQGNAYSQQKLGVSYELGIGTKQNYAKAALWYSKAADQGNKRAQGNLGTLYSNGKGVKKDLAKAVAWYSKAAEQGDSAAQNNLGTLYYNGKGVPQDFEKARNLYTKAAEQGSETALFNLGVMFRDGDGIKKNLVSAHIYFNLSAAKGDTDAKTERNTIARKLSSENLKAAQQYASAWKTGDKLPYSIEDENPDKFSGVGQGATYAASERIDHFEVTLFGCTVKSDLGLKNKSAGPKPSADSEFLILDVSFKNEDTESRIPLAGSVFINYGGKRYKFDSPETVWQDGWDLRFGKINPLLTERTKLAYRIPLHMRGDADWVPGRNQENIKLTCGF
ncbi:MAG: tetratricopeptide repeat protein [Pseudomonadota bacterium]|nr:tetratricopeptide repeat protein [Pseudomonadota bacterium]